MGPHPAVFDWNRDKASSVTLEKAECGLVAVTQWKRCHQNDETASVRRVRQCRSHGGDVRMCIKQAPCLLCTDVEVVSVARQRICFKYD